MTTESKARAASIKSRREALGLSFEGFYDAARLTLRAGEFVENGQYGKNVEVDRDLAETLLTLLEEKKQAKAPAANAKKEKAREATKKQLEKFANVLCQALLKADQSIATFTWAKFYELLKAETGCDQFNVSLLESIVSNNTTLQVPFLISFGNVVVVLCKDTLFAPVELDAVS